MQLQCFYRREIIEARGVEIFERRIREAASACLKAKRAFDVSSLQALHTSLHSGLHHSARQVSTLTGTLAGRSLNMGPIIATVSSFVTWKSSIAAEAGRDGNGSGGGGSKGVDDGGSFRRMSSLSLRRGSSLLGRPRSSSAPAPRGKVSREADAVGAPRRPLLLLRARFFSGGEPNVRVFAAASARVASLGLFLARLLSAPASTCFSTSRFQDWVRTV